MDKEFETTFQEQQLRVNISKANKLWTKVKDVPRQPPLADYPVIETSIEDFEKVLNAIKYIRSQPPREF
jgi:hypothetical protein